MFVSHLHDNRHQITAHLAKTMSFLALSTAELEATLIKELNDNPALELVEELRCPSCGKRLHRLPCPTCAAPSADGSPVVYLSPREPRNYRSTEAENDEALDIRTPERLDEHILRQIGPALTRAERPLAAYLLARLDDDGLLPEAIPEVAAFNHVHPRDVERVLSLIQHADPPGVGAQTPQESLLIQLECLAEVTTPLMTKLARTIIQHHFEALGKMDYARIARQLRLPRESVEAAARFIQRNLTPYPARVFWGDGKHPVGNDGAALRDTDASISILNRAEGGPLMVEVFAPLSGWLRVQPEFKAALEDCAETEQETWGAAVERAALIAKCIQQRNHTMRRLMQIIAEEQRDFILGGDGDLRPLTRAKIAHTLGVHESTISRAVAGKAVALPDGRIVPLSKFFDRSLSVRDRVRHLVNEEKSPLTDDQIAAALADQGLQVARRTVAKYRKMLGILPAAMRVRNRQAQLRPYKL